jgi:hypothetical protein
VSINDDTHAIHNANLAALVRRPIGWYFGVIDASKTWVIAFAVACMHPGGGQLARASGKQQAGRHVAAGSNGIEGIHSNCK